MEITLKLEQIILQPFIKIIMQQEDQLSENFIGTDIITLKAIQL